jgi:signal transduction histidine kinase
MSHFYHDDNHNAAKAATETLFVVKIQKLQEKQKEIFDKFSQVDHHSKIQGVGLSFAFCKMAIKAHKGHT